MGKVNIMATKSPEELIKKVEPVLSIKLSTVDSLQKWTTLCTGRRTCVVLAHKSAAAKEGAKNIFTPLLQKHRQVKVVNLDVAFWALRLGQNLTDTRPQLKIAKPNDLDVVCLTRADGVKAKKEVHFGSYLQNLESADNFLSDCAGQKNLLSLGVEPKIGAKQTRNEQSEVIEAEPLPKDFFKDEQKKPTADGKRDAVGSRGNLHQEKIVEDVDESEQTSEEQSDQSEEDEGEEVEL